MYAGEISSITRKEEITRRYLDLVDRHVGDIVHGRTYKMMELKEIAAELCVSHKHLTDTVKQTMGHHPCHFYDMKILEWAKKLLRETSQPVAQIALTLTYDPSNFSKFFKKFTGETPGAYRRRARSR